jgi:hypothetical protein
MAGRPWTLQIPKNECTVIAAVKQQAWGSTQNMVSKLELSAKYILPNGRLDP